MRDTYRTYRCLDCGQVWTWRTPEDMRALHDIARVHRLEVVRGG